MTCPISRHENWHGSLISNKDGWKEFLYMKKEILAEFNQSRPSFTDSQWAVTTEGKENAEEKRPKWGSTVQILEKWASHTLEDT